MRWTLPAIGGTMLGGEDDRGFVSAIICLISVNIGRVDTSHTAFLSPHQTDRSLHSLKLSYFLSKLVTVSG